MPGRPTRAQELGLIEEITQDDEDTFSIRLTDDSGETLFAKKGYSNELTAHKAGGAWIRNHYRPNTRPRPGVTPPPSNATQSGQLLSLMRTRATDNETQAQRLRSQADLLESEAKRLHAAADVLEGPEAD